MSTISNNALTQDSWKNYQAQYDQIDWGHKPLEVTLNDEDMARFLMVASVDHDPSLRTAV